MLLGRDSYQSVVTEGRTQTLKEAKEKDGTAKELMRLWSLLLKQRTPDSSMLACLTSLVSCPSSGSSVRAQKSNSTSTVSGKMLGTIIVCVVGCLVQKGLNQGRGAFLLWVEEPPVVSLGTNVTLTPEEQ